MRLSRSLTSVLQIETEVSIMVLSSYALCGSRRIHSFLACSLILARAALLAPWTHPRVLTHCGSTFVSR